MVSFSSFGPSLSPTCPEKSPSECVSTRIVHYLRFDFAQLTAWRLEERRTTVREVRSRKQKAERKRWKGKEAEEGEAEEGPMPADGKKSLLLRALLPSSPPSLVPFLAQKNGYRPSWSPDAWSPL